jgi:hypothetical protein
LINFGDESLVLPLLGATSVVVATDDAVEVSDGQASLPAHSAVIVLHSDIHPR